MKDKKEPIVLDLDIFIHLMTSAYREERARTFRDLKTTVPPP